MPLNARLLRFLRINSVLPPLDRRGIDVGDKVRVLPKELKYGRDVGKVTGIVDQTLDDDFIFQVTFERYYPYMDEPWYKGERGKFVEYFAPQELVKV